MSEVLHFADLRIEHDAHRLASADAPDQGIAELDAWLLLRAAGRDARAVWLAPDDDYAQLRSHIEHLDLIALQFPKAADGRAYSIAAILRTQYGYRGQLRAFGDIAVDQLFYMKRVGFDSAALAPEQCSTERLPTLRAALARFSQGYQGAYDEPLPLFKRRLLCTVLGEVAA